MKFENAQRPMRICKTSKDIIKIFTKIKTSNSVFTIWQTVNGKRCSSEAYLYNIDQKNGTLAIKPTPNNQFKFEKPFSVYIYGDGMSLLFKSSSNLTMDKMIILKIPKEVRLVEKRGKPRISFDAKNIEGNIVKKTGYDDLPHEFTLRILDISQSGIAMIVYSHDLALFTIDSKLSLTKVGGVELCPEIEGIVIYTREMNKKGQTSSKPFRVGVKFRDIINHQQILELSTI